MAAISFLERDSGATPSRLVICSIDSCWSRVGAGPFKLSAEEALVWEGVLFHLALLLCARQVVRRREGASERAREKATEGAVWGGESERERKRESA